METSHDPLFTGASDLMVSKDISISSLMNDSDRPEDVSEVMVHSVSPVLAAAPPASSTPTRVTLASMINPEEPPLIPIAPRDPAPEPPKKKQPRKRKAPEPKAASTIIVDGKPIEVKPATPTQPKKRAKKEPSGESEPKGKAKAAKKEEEKPAAPPPPPAPKPLTTAPRATILDVSDPLAKPETTEVEEPIIALHIPLSAPGALPGKSQNILNVMKMCEDKYGWKRMHPNAKFTLEEDDIDLEEDDDGEDMEVDGEDSAVAPEQTRQRARRNDAGKRKIGKYDLNDPFIDDAEMEWEEQRAATTDGFFVYYGPLIEEGQYARIEKAEGPAKRSRPGAASGRAKPGASSRSKAPAKPRARPAAATTAKKVAIAPKSTDPTPEPDAEKPPTLAIAPRIEPPLGEIAAPVSNAT